MKAKSKYLGKVYEGFEVVDYFKRNDYKRLYRNETKVMTHNAYSYVLYNKEIKDGFIISGNQLRLLEHGVRKMADMLSAKRGNKNRQLNLLKKKYICKEKV